MEERMKKSFEDGLRLKGLSNLIKSKLSTIKYTPQNKVEESLKGEMVQKLKSHVDEMHNLVKKYEELESVKRIYQNIMVNLDIRLPEEYKQDFKQFLDEQ